MAHAILETVSTTILFHLKDPRVKNVTVLNVEVAGDMRTAKVYVSVMGDEKTQALCMHGLRSARGFIQSKLASRLESRYIPVLTFVLDQSVKKSAEAARILREVLPHQELPERGDLDGDAVDELGHEDSVVTNEGEIDSRASFSSSTQPAMGSTHPQRSPPETPTDLVE